MQSWRAKHCSPSWYDPFQQSIISWKKKTILRLSSFTSFLLGKAFVVVKYEWKRMGWGGPWLFNPESSCVESMHIHLSKCKFFHVFFVLYSKQNNSPFSKTRYEFSAGVVTTCICPYSKSLSSTCFLTSSISVSLPWVKAFSTNSQLV